MSAQLERWQFNVDQFYQLAEVGVLTPDDRVELIEGEIIKMGPIGSPHAACVAKTYQRLSETLSGRVIVWIQNPVRLNDFSEPVPDVALLRPRQDFYVTHHPTPADVLLIMEVSDTSILSDRNIKIPLYARAQIPEAWLVNLNKKVIEVYYDLTDGQYDTCTKFGLGETLVSPNVAGLSLKVDEIIS
jgi:Uma2 family endonuclease